MSISASETIRDELRRTAEEIDRCLAARTARLGTTAPRLVEAMRHSLSGGGKRLRPALVMWCCELCGGDHASALAPAMAIECVHSFSLVHDDLPALDDDDVRRGQAATHRVFGEALAILAGDALLALAFEILSEEVSSPDRAVAMTRELATATGAAGMIGGESLDIEGESHAPDLDEVERIHSLKTARLIESACRLGGLAAEASESQLRALSDYGRALGLAFQVADDLLDVDGTLQETGKQTGKDARAGKQTYPRAVGPEASRVHAEQMADQAVAALAPWGRRAERLASLARYVVERTA
ncbi:MAG: polyprenyl synthetase family protein [Phycisphaerae bacterium]